jgi:preprotein translocase subunit YajC
VTVEIAPGVNARYARPAIAKIVKQETTAAEVPDDEPVATDPVTEPGATTAIESPVVETRKKD